MSVILALVYGYVPYLILPLLAALDRIDKSVLEAARDLGASLAQVLGHVTFSLSYVVVIVRGRLLSIGRQYEEAAADLGATPWESLRLVLLPLLLPAILASLPAANDRPPGRANPSSAIWVLFVDTDANFPPANR